jgi:2-octaprenyl-6-methoxyphenol hydroxylase
LLVGAEGRNSPIREAASIPIARWSYDHVAIVATISHQRDHENVAYEIFYPDGPFAVLPMLAGEEGRPRSAIVWSVKAGDAPAILDLPERRWRTRSKREWADSSALSSLPARAGTTSSASITLRRSPH